LENVIGQNEEESYRNFVTQDIKYSQNEINQHQNDQEMEFSSEDDQDEPQQKVGLD